jgi:hypothetical protein
MILVAGYAAAIYALDGESLRAEGLNALRLGRRGPAAAAEMEAR